MYSFYERSWGLGPAAVGSPRRRCVAPSLIVKIAKRLKRTIVENCKVIKAHKSLYYLLSGVGVNSVEVEYSTY